MADFWVYILTNLPRRTVLYVGVTNSLDIGMFQHRTATSKGFAWRYNARHLVYFEHFPEPGMAIARETQLKGWRRSKKENLINRFNSGWRDLGAEMFGNNRSQPPS